MEEISKSFPGVQALNKVDFELYEGEVMGLVGENGAGKSTLMKILSGAYQKDAGRIFLDGRKIEIESPYHAQKLGISTIYQEFNLTPNQTVAQNIFCAREPIKKSILGNLGFVDKELMEKEAQKLLGMVEADISPKEMIRDLSIAEKQMVEIAKALAFKAKIIIMDEPTSALGLEEVEKLFEIINQLRTQGIAIIFVSHRLEEVFRIADRITILRDGKLVGVMRKEEANIEKVIYLMVNRPLSEMFQKEEVKTEEAILEVKNLYKKGVIKNTSFKLYKGEILGVAGLVGAGRTEMVRLIFGADKKDKGEIYLEGKKVEINTPADAVKLGIGLVPEDRQGEGLILKLAVRENIGICILRNLVNTLFVNKNKLSEIAQNFIQRLNIRTPSIFQKVLYLSGGNQQKVVLSKWLALNPKILILDEPTRGIDVSAKAEIHTIMNQLAKSGIGIIMISSEMPEILAMSDRVLVMNEGKLVAEISKKDATQEKIMAYASGYIN